MTKPWFDDSGIVASTLQDLMEAAYTPQFGESQRETLVTFLMCTSFDYRFDPDIARAFHLAAMIISKVDYDHIL